MSAITRRPRAAAAVSAPPSTQEISPQTNRVSKIGRRAVWKQPGRYSTWTKKELSALQSFATSERLITWEVFAKTVLKGLHTVDACKHQAAFNGWVSSKRQEGWNTEDVEILKTYFAKKQEGTDRRTWVQFAEEEFKGRHTWLSCSSKASSIGLQSRKDRTWTPEEINQITTYCKNKKEGTDKRTWIEFAQEELEGRHTPEACKYQSYWIENNSNRKQRKDSWTPEEESKLITYYRNKQLGIDRRLYQQFAEEDLKNAHGVQACRMKVVTLGLTSKKQHKVSQDRLSEAAPRPVQPDPLASPGVVDQREELYVSDSTWEPAEWERIITTAAPRPVQPDPLASPGVVDQREELYVSDSTWEPAEWERIITTFV